MLAGLIGLVSVVLVHVTWLEVFGSMMPSSTPIAAAGVSGGVTPALASEAVAAFKAAPPSVNAAQPSVNAAPPSVKAAPPGAPTSQIVHLLEPASLAILGIGLVLLGLARHGGGR